MPFRNPFTLFLNLEILVYIGKILYANGSKI